ncbi:MAG: A/G-specific adenine glycosylase [Cryobacterium sp.]|nr:A/G-specific adenine glycosylase [Oligoflexia bacterium]
MGSTNQKASAESLPSLTPIPLDALSKLVAWFRRGNRVLPWREEPTLYRVWISEIMLQQTQVVTVVPYFERFIAEFPSVEHLARADSESVMKAWAGLGYYSRARNIHQGAKTIAQKGFPKTKEGWLEISGVGPYTAGAITSIALGLPEPIVDGNVERVFARLRILRRSLGDAPYKTSLWWLSGEAVATAHAAGLSPSDLNQAWMELGATVCVPRKPQCGLCPISIDCEALKAGIAELLPEKKKRPEVKILEESRVALVDVIREKVYLEQARTGEWREGLWDFPKAGGEFVGVKRGDEIITKHVVTNHRITRALEVRVVDSESRAVRDYPGRWISMNDPEVGIGSAPKKGIAAIRAGS